MLETLESTVESGKATELRIATVFPPPTSNDICLNLRIKEVIENRAERPIRVFVPAAIMLIRPQNSDTLTIPIEPNSNGRWVQVQLTISGLDQPYQLVVKQEGPRASPDPAAANNIVPVELRLALQTVGLSNGKC